MTDSRILAFFIGVVFGLCFIWANEASAATQPPLGWNWVCYSAQKDYVDPIAFPGLYPTHHKHDIFGSKITPDTTALQLSTQPNNCKFAHSSVDEGDKSVAWEPVPYYKGSGDEVRTSQVNVYYRVAKGVKPATVKPPPFGLKFIIGSPTAEGAQDHIKWRCPGESGSGQGTPIDCTRYGTHVKISYFLPSCSDGRKDSADHQSHVVYPSPRNGCPASHPRAIPAINLSFGIKTEDGTAIEFKDVDGHQISPHADYFNGTPREVWRKWIDRCITSSVGGCAGTGVAGRKNP